MTFFIASLSKDLRRRMADPAAFAIWLGIPLLLGGLMVLVAGGDGPPTARLLVVDQDDSLLTDFLLGAAGSEQLGEFLQLEEVRPGAGRERIDAGDASALLILPEGLGEAVLNEEPATLELITNPAQRILPAIIEEGLEILIEAVFYVQRLFGEPLRQILDLVTEVEAAAPEGAPGPGAKQAAPGGSETDDGPTPPGPSDEDVAGISVEINRTMQRIGDLAFPPVLTLEDESEGAGEAADEAAEEASSDGDIGIGRLFLPGILFMSLIFIAQGLSSDLWQERDQGTLRRVLGTRGHVLPWFAGKLVSGALVMAVVSVIAGVMAAGLYEAPLGRLPVALLWCIYGGTAMLCYFLLFQSLTTSQRGGNLVTTLIVFPLIMIGGSFFPFEAMPGWMAEIGAWTPNGLALIHLKEMLWGQPVLLEVTAAALGLGLPALAAAWLCLRRIRGEFAL